MRPVRTIRSNRIRARHPFPVWSVKRRPVSAAQGKSNEGQSIIESYRASGMFTNYRWQAFTENILASIEILSQKNRLARRSILTATPLQGRSASFAHNGYGVRPGLQFTRRTDRSCFWASWMTSVIDSEEETIFIDPNYSGIRKQCSVMPPVIISAPKRSSKLREFHNISGSTISKT